MDSLLAALLAFEFWFYSSAFNNLPKLACYWAFSFAGICNSLYLLFTISPNCCWPRPSESLSVLTLLLVWVYLHCSWYHWFISSSCLSCSSLVMFLLTFFLYLSTVLYLAGFTTCGLLLPLSVKTLGFIYGVKLSLFNFDYLALNRSRIVYAFLA